MKNEGTIKELLGMKQEYMSMLLQISRSQWSMYVLGKRNLPINAKLKLAEMLGFLKQNNNKTYQNFEDKKEQDSKILKLLTTQQLLNAKLQIISKQKLKEIQRKYENATTALQFIQFLETKTQKPTKQYQLLMETIKLNAQTEIEKNDLTIQTTLQYKHEILQAEEEILNTKIKSYR